MSNIVEADLVSPSEEIRPKTDDRPYRRLGWGVLIGLIGVFSVWAAFAPLESAIPANGKVIVSSQNRVIQHLEGGIVKGINVKDGDSVKEGDTLITLDPTQATSQLKIIEATYFHFLASEARLLAERNHASTLTFSNEFFTPEGAPYLNEMSNQRREFESRKSAMSEEVAVLNQRLDQLEYQIEGLKSTISGKESLLKTYEEETKELEGLFKQQLIDKLRLREAQRQLVTTKSEIAAAQSEISRAQSQINEVKAQISSMHENFMKDVLSELSDTQTRLADNKARLSGLRDIVKRGVIKAPSDGIVTNLKIHTVGGVLAAGTPVMEIVPSSDQLIIQGSVIASDITNVHVGLKADVQFPGFAHVKSLKEVQGEVIHIGADAVEDEQHNLLYPVKILITEDGKKEIARNKLVLQPGMPASVMIVVAERTFADYLIHPFKQMLRASFNEQ